MASIDKTYVTGKQLSEALEWARSIGGVAHFETGLDLDFLTRYIGGYNPEVVEGTEEIDPEGKYILWNTPLHFDRWLLQNCPLRFVQDRLQEVYDDETLVEMAEYRYEPWVRNPGQHWTFLERPVGRYTKGYVKFYRVDVKSSSGELLAYNGIDWEPRSKWQLYASADDFPGDITKKAINRLVKSWLLPIETVIIFRQIRYRGLDWTVRIKK